MMIAGYVVLDGFDLGAGILHLWSRGTTASAARCWRSIGPVWDGNEVWLLAGGRHAVLRVSGALCRQLQRILSAADDGAVAADSARAFRSNSAITSDSRSGRRSGTRSSASRALCSPFSSARRWAMWCAACRLTPHGCSSSRCGPTFDPAAGIPGFWTGSRCWSA